MPTEPLHKKGRIPVLSQGKRQTANGKSHDRTPAGFCGRFYLLPFAFCLCACGCAGFWDDVTSRDFTWSGMFNKPNPLLVLRDSSDGDKRACALRALREPKQYGGSDAEQDAIVNILTTAATTEKQPLCRLAAIGALGHFKDPRSVKGLSDAFYN